MPLLRADPHHWDAGQVHQINPDSDKTLCGKSPARCPGTKFYGNADRITCKLCLRSIAAKARMVELRAQWVEQDHERWL